MSHLLHCRIFGAQFATQALRAVGSVLARPLAASMR